LIEEIEYSPAVLEQAQVAALYYYPVKSCRGIAVSQAEVIETGFRYDREFMLVERNTGLFLSQRELPRMALIQPEMRDSRLHLEAPGMPVFEIPVVEEGTRVLSTVWSNRCESVDQGDEVAAWFSEFLKLDVRLVRMALDFKRRVKPIYAVSGQEEVSFVDSMPFLILSLESLQDLNRRLEKPVLTDRFRPNIVLSGSNLPYGEDRLKQAQIGEITMRATKPCARCEITTIDQQNVQTGKEPLRTLATYRRSESGSVVFGQYFIHENNGTIKTGDRLKVLTTKKPRVK
jgi:uncharacterized protein YcbX